jgi:hypothetical protein
MDRIAEVRLWLVPGADLLSAPVRYMLRRNGVASGHTYRSVDSAYLRDNRCGWVEVKMLFSLKLEGSHRDPAARGIPMGSLDAVGILHG